VLTITPGAAEAIRGLLAAVTPPDAAIRISPASGEGERWDLAVSEEPAPGDRVVCDSDVELLVAPDASSKLDDKILDARMEGGRVKFSVEPRRG
jgi:iron-sulfur cluster assembly protein